jgi:ribosomal protein L25 (general stress protein Ctc)
VLGIDFHQHQIQGFFDIPVDHLYAAPVLTRYFLDKGLEDLVVVAPDVGSAKMARGFAKRLGASFAIIDKRRPAPQPVRGAHRRGRREGPELHHHRRHDRHGGTMASAVVALKDRGARAVYACATHALLSGKARERSPSAPLEELVVTNTIHIPEDRKFEGLTVLSVAELLARAIEYIHSNDSVSQLFEIRGPKTTTEPNPPAGPDPVGKRTGLRGRVRKERHGNQAKLKAERRSETGKGVARKLRQAGKLPAVLYGGTRTPSPSPWTPTTPTLLFQSISVENTIVNLEVEGESPRCHAGPRGPGPPFRPEILHVDFLRVRRAWRSSSPSPRAGGDAEGRSRGGRRARAPRPRGLPDPLHSRRRSPRTSDRGRRHGLSRSATRSSSMPWRSPRA